MLNEIIERNQLNSTNNKEKIIVKIKLEALDAIINSQNKGLYKRNIVYQTIIDTIKQDYALLYKNLLLNIEQPTAKTPIGYQLNKDKRKKTKTQTEEMEEPQKPENKQQPKYISSLSNQEPSQIIYK